MDLTAATCLSMNEWASHNDDDDDDDDGDDDDDDGDDHDHDHHQDQSCLWSIFVY